MWSYRPSRPPAGGRAPRCRPGIPSARRRTGARWPGGIIRRVGVSSMSQKSAKRRRREQRLQQEQGSINSQYKVEHLEVLLKAGDIDGYAQACWALANNRDETPIAGEVVTLSGPCEEHGLHEKSFRLTPQTLMTIAQLTGMETCGAAIRLVAKKVPPEKLPCYPHGHREQAYEQMMLGSRTRRVHLLRRYT